MGRRSLSTYFPAAYPYVEGRSLFVVAFVPSTLQSETPAAWPFEPGRSRRFVMKSRFPKSRYLLPVLFFVTSIVLAQTTPSRRFKGHLPPSSTRSPSVPTARPSPRPASTAPSSSGTMPPARETQRSSRDTRPLSTRSLSRRMEPSSPRAATTRPFASGTRRTPEPARAHGAHRPRRFDRLQPRQQEARVRLGRQDRSPLGPGQTPPRAQETRRAQGFGL